MRSIYLARHSVFSASMPRILMPKSINFCHKGLVFNNFNCDSQSRIAIVITEFNKNNDNKLVVFNQFNCMCIQHKLRDGEKPTAITRIEAVNILREMHQKKILSDPEYYSAKYQILKEASSVIKIALLGKLHKKNKISGEKYYSETLRFLNWQKDEKSTFKKQYYKNVQKILDQQYEKKLVSDEKYYHIKQELLNEQVNIKLISDRDYYYQSEHILDQQYEKNLLEHTIYYRYKHELLICQLNNNLITLEQFENAYEDLSYEIIPLHFRI